MPAVQVGDRTEDDLGVFLELAEPGVTAATQDPTNATSFVIMINLRRRTFAADSTNLALNSDEFGNLARTDTISTDQMVVARTSVQPLDRFATPCVMTSLAVGVTAIRRVPVPWEIFKRLSLLTVRANLEDILMIWNALLRHVPTSGSQVLERPKQPRHVLLKLAYRTITSETKDPSNFPRLVMMIHVLRFPLGTYRAEIILLSEQFGYPVARYPVAMLQHVIPDAAVQLLSIASSDSVVTRLAVVTSS